MATKQWVGSSPAVPGPDGSGVTERVVEALVQAGLVQPDQAGQARVVVAGVLPMGPGRSERSRRSRLPEVAGYVGAALVLAAVALLLAQQWRFLSTGQRILWLSAIALIFAVATTVITSVVGPRAALLTPAGLARHHLGAVLTVFTAVAVAATVGVWTHSLTGNTYGSNTEINAALAAALLVLLIGYCVNPHPLPHLAGGFATFMLVTSWNSGNDQGWEYRLAGTAALVAAGWLALSERRIWREPTLGRLVGSAFALFAVQATGFGQASSLAVALATVALAALLVGAYVWRDDPAFLVIGIFALTLGVTQALIEITDGSLGAGGAVLVAGVTLLAASGAALRLRDRRGSGVP